MTDLPLTVKAEVVPEPTEATVLAWAVDYDGSGRVSLFPIFGDADPANFDPRRSEHAKDALATLVKITIPLDALRASR